MPGIRSQSALIPSHRQALRAAPARAQARRQTGCSCCWNSGMHRPDRLMAGQAIHRLRRRGCQPRGMPVRSRRLPERPRASSPRPAVTDSQRVPAVAARAAANFPPPESAPAGSHTAPPGPRPRGSVAENPSAEESKTGSCPLPPQEPARLPPEAGSSHTPPRPARLVRRRRSWPPDRPSGLWSHRRRRNRWGSSWWGRASPSAMAS